MLCLAVYPAQLSDLSTVSRKIPREVASVTAGSNVQRRLSSPLLIHDQPTSGIGYVRIGFNASQVPESLLPLLPLYTRCLTQIGTARSTEVCVRSNESHVAVGALLWRWCCGWCL